MNPTQPFGPQAYQAWKSRLEQLNAELTASEGYRYWYYIGEFGKSFDIWNDEHVELANLLLSYERDPELVIRLNSEDHPDERDQLVRVLDRKALSCLAALKALEDHIKTTLHVVSSPALKEEYDSRYATTKREHASVAFVQRFRNYLQHHKTAPWVTKLQFRPGHLEGEMCLNATTLLAWDGFSGGAKRFLRDQERDFPFRPVLVEFGERFSELVLWYCEAVRQEGTAAMAEAELLQQAVVQHHDSYIPSAGAPPAPGASG